MWMCQWHLWLSFSLLSVFLSGASATDVGERCVSYAPLLSLLSYDSSCVVEVSVVFTPDACFTVAQSLIFTFLGSSVFESVFGIWNVLVLFFMLLFVASLLLLHFADWFWWRSVALSLSAFFWCAIIVQANMCHTADDWLPVCLFFASESVVAP